MNELRDTTPFVEIVTTAVNQLYELAQGYRNDWSEFDGRQLKCEVGAILDPVTNALEAERAALAAPRALEGPTDQDAIEAIRSDEAVRDAFVDCYTLQSIITEEQGNNVNPEQLKEWDRVESVLIRAILARGGAASPRWQHLIDVVTAYVSDRPVPGGDSDRAVVLAAIERIRGVSRALPEPTEAAIKAALNVCPAQFRGVQPYGGVMQPMLAPEQIATMLRAAYAVQFGGGGSREGGGNTADV